MQVMLQDASHVAGCKSCCMMQVMLQDASHVAGCKSYSIDQRILTALDVLMHS
jgi:hypothetical protein